MPADAATLVADFDLQDIVSLNLSRSVQLTVDIGAHLIASIGVPPPDTMGQTFDLLAQAGLLNVELANHLKKAVGFRNIAIQTCLRSPPRKATLQPLCSRGFPQERRFATR